MRFAHFAMLALVSAAVGVACSSSSGPDTDPPPGGNCVTDFSCAFNEECNGASCGPITPALHSHIQLASCQLRAPLDAGEASWRASHYDLLIAGFYADQTRAVNPNIRLFEYAIARYNRFDRPNQPTTASAWASAHGYNGEDFYLHYKEDVNVPTWEGRNIVPGYPDGMVTEDIPLVSRIIAVADAYNAMTSDRPYRDAMPSRVARLRLAQAVDSQFDTAAVAAFEALLAGADEDYRLAKRRDFTQFAQSQPESQEDDVVAVADVA